MRWLQFIETGNYTKRAVESAQILDLFKSILSQRPEYDPTKAQIMRIGWIAHLHLFDSCNYLKLKVPEDTLLAARKLKKKGRDGALAAAYVLNGRLLKTEDIPLDPGVY